MHYFIFFTESILSTVSYPDKKLKKINVGKMVLNEKLN